jgi:hypothetical protein
MKRYYPGIAPDTLEGIELEETPGSDDVEALGANLDDTHFGAM